MVSNLNKETSHSFVGVVVSSNGVDHLDAVHQSWKDFFNGLRVSRLKWLNEFFKSLEILDIIFSLIESLGDSKLDSSPFRGSKVDLSVWLS